MDILKKIIETRKKAFNEELQAFSSFRSHLPKMDFKEALKGASPAVIAEVKYASPAKGDFGVVYSPGELALMYKNAGASAISVLACKDFFKGSPSFVYQAKHTAALPVLWKDFVFDPRQIELAANHGADAILLICAVLENQLPKFLKYCKEKAIQPVVEVASENEAEFATQSGCDIVLINNRDLKTMQVNLSMSKKLRGYFSKDTTVISASGINSRADIIELSSYDIKNFLIGEKLSRADNPEEVLRQLLGA